jgi:hypothetical protein
MTSCINGGLKICTTGSGIDFIRAGRNGKYLPNIDASDAPIVALSQSGENPGFWR